MPGGEPSVVSQKFATGCGGPGGMNRKRRKANINAMNDDDNAAIADIVRTDSGDCVGEFLSRVHVDGVGRPWHDNQLASGIEAPQVAADSVEVGLAQFA